MRTLLYEAVQTLLTRVTKWSWLKAWATNVAKRRGMRKAIVALDTRTRGAGGPVQLRPSVPARLAKRLLQPCAG